MAGITEGVVKKNGCVPFVEKSEYKTMLQESGNSGKNKTSFKPQHRQKPVPALGYHFRRIV
jgi:hypothetical protein